ncbi:hypothetical protein KO465_07490 [Candidatus Micrarchaeota archaeon]|jgi:hypothetical protein|nr:hypothetical protein [Candidatus Micrarchaeota archaeon]
MKISISVNSLSIPGGLQNWARTVSEELLRLNHRVTVVTDNIGTYAQVFNCEVTDKFPKCDISLVNNKDFLERSNGFKIFTSHTFLTDKGRFSKGADAYVSISKEIQDLEAKRGFKSTVIGNPVDFSLFRFTPTKKLDKVLFLSKDGRKATFNILEACQKMGLKVLIVDHANYAHIHNIIKEADLVITSGRSTVESMACGKNVLSANHRTIMKDFTGAGLITPDNYLENMKDWFSGRNNPIYFDTDKLIEQIKLYDSNYSQELNKLTFKHFDARKNVKKYLSLYG